LAAGVEDTLRAFPQANGVIIDGAGEHHYELAFHHGGELFEIGDHHRAIYTHLAFDVPRMERGIDHLKDRFHNLTPSLVRFHASGGMFGLALFDLNEDALYWLRMRQESTPRNMQAIRGAVERAERPAQIGRDPALSRIFRAHHAGLPEDARVFRLHFSEALLLASRF
jgi:hypothetical protein